MTNATAASAPIAAGAWTSGLSTAEFAATLEAGLTPLGFVQGCSVVNWNFYGFGLNSLGLGGGQLSGYSEQYSCPHGIVSNEHRRYGLNYEKTWLERAYKSSFAAAKERLVNEARAMGACGVIDIVERTEYHSESGAFEFTLNGTAVGLSGVAPPSTPFTTYLAGQRFNRLIEAGFVPVEITLAISAIGVYSSCVTEYQLRGAGATGLGFGQMSYGAIPAGEITQITNAEIAARSLVREQLRPQLHGDILHGALLKVRSHESAEGPQIEAILQGTRVRQYRDFAPIAPPRPVIRLVDR